MHYLYYALTESGCLALSLDKPIRTQEIYLGTDNKVYRSVYYLAFIETEPKIHYKYTPHNLRKKRVSDEVNSVMWCTFPTAVKKLSEGISGWKEKIEVLKNVFASLIKNGKRREGRRHSV